MIDPVHPEPGQDALVDDVAGALYDWRERRVHCDWENHQRAVAVLALLRERGMLKGASKPPVQFRQLTPAGRVGVVLATLVFVWGVLIVGGLLAWAAVAVWGRVLA